MGRACSRASPLTALKLGNQIDAAMFFARADFVNVHHLQRRKFLISIASPVPEAVEIFRSFVRNLAPDFTHYIRVAHEDT